MPEPEAVVVCVALPPDVRSNEGNIRGRNLDRRVNGPSRGDATDTSTREPESRIQFQRNDLVNHGEPTAG